MSVFKYKTLMFKLQKAYSSDMDPQLENEMDTRINTFASQGYIIGDAFVEENWLMVMMIKEERTKKSLPSRKNG